MKTTVVNLRTCKDKDIIRIDRTTIFGNPFVMQAESERAEVIHKYREYFYVRVGKDVDFLNKILKLKSKKLGCWCKPKACHGDIIVEYLEFVYF